MLFSVSGPPAYRRSVHRSGRREDAHETAGDHLWGKSWPSQQRRSQGAKNRECQQKLTVFINQGEFLSGLFETETGFVLVSQTFLRSVCVVTEKGMTDPEWN